MEKSILNYQSILDRLSQPVLLFDHQGEIRYQNKSAKDFFEHSYLEGGQKKLENLFQFSPEELSELWDNIGKDKNLNLQQFGRIKGGDITLCQLKVQPFKIPLASKSGCFVEVIAETKLDLSDEDFLRLGLRFSEIGHDIANPLAVIKMQRSALLREGNDKQKLEANEIEKRVHKMEKATKRLEICNVELKGLSQQIIENDLNGIKSLQLKREKAESH